MTSSELEAWGICWRCRGINSASLSDCTKGTSSNTPHHNDETLLHRVKWRGIGRDCALCNEIKQVLQPCDTTLRRMEHSSLKSDDLVVECWLQNIKKQSKQQCLSIRSYVQPFNVGEVHLIPNTIIQHTSAGLSDISLARQWLDQCQDDHKGSCISDKSFEHNSRVIDCHSRKLCHIDPGTRYICLSYVWGSTAIVDRESVNSLARTPKVVEDSLWVALQLDIPYL
jgi:hypothetical protein